jgi:molybdopterin-containing oxidoreductase family membrane subunit
MDAFTTFYGGDRAERVMFIERTLGYYRYVYWGTVLFNCLLPQVFWVRRLRLKQPFIVSICLCVVVGMWLERYEIVVTSLHRPNLPSAWGIYHATFWDWSTLLGTVGMFLSGILLAVRYLPIVSMHEMRTLIATTATHNAAEQAP